MDAKEEIKQKIDIAELIGEFVDLKPAGVERFKGVCPFHAENTPSFHVSRDKQVYHCFGCAEGGDIFSFIMKMEGLDFPEALRLLGERAGVEVKRFDTKESNERQRVMRINDLAARYYHVVLMESPKAAVARAYLDDRGIPVELRERFLLGFAPDAWDSLASFLEKKGFRGQDGIAAGLLLRKRSGSGFIDRFRNRVMVPLSDHHGNVVGFTGRIMPGADKETAKYMNSPETAVYKKGELLYGLHLAKQAAKKSGHIVIVEGNLDVVSSHKAGVEHVVASSGTALTEHQLTLLKRYTGVIAFAFDNDAAGFRAAQKGIRLARDLGFDVRAVVLPEGAGKDPDEAVQKDPAIWREASEASVPIMEYLIARAAAGRDLNDIDDKRDFSRLVLPEIGLVRDVVEREHWLQKVSDLLRTDIAALRRAAPPQDVPDSVRKPAPVPLRTPQLSEETREERASRLLLGILVSREELVGETRDRLDPILLTDTGARALYSALLLAYDQGQSERSAQQPLFQRLRSHLESSATELVPLLDQAGLLAEQELSRDEVLPSVPGQIRDLIGILKESHSRQRRAELAHDIRLAEEAGDTKRAEELVREYQSLT